MEAQKEVVRANKLESCYLRPIAFYGSEKMGVSPRGAAVHVAIAAWPWGAYLGEEGLEKGIRVKTASFARHHVNVTMPRQGRHDLRQLDPRKPRGHAGRVRRGAAARHHGLRRRRCRREPVRDQERQDLRAADHLRPLRHHARNHHPSPPTSGRKSGKSRSPATTSTSPTKPSSPAPPPK